MKKRLDDMNLWGAEPPQDDTYECPTMDSSDEEIEAFIEQERREYYKAWLDYVKDFD